MEGASLPRHWLLRVLELETTSGRDDSRATRDAIIAFLEVARELSVPDQIPERTAVQLSGFAQRLRQARPTDLVLRRALDRTVSALAGGPAEVAAVLERILADADSVELALLRVGGTLLRPGSRVITLGYHPLLEQLLVQFGSSLEGVTVCEGRPRQTGIRLAGAVGAQTVPVRLICEASLELVAPECDLALAVAERVLPDGNVVTPAGTAVLARVCGGHQVPFYVFAETDCWVAPGTDLAHFGWERRPPSEVLTHVPRGVQLLNVAYDLTPRQLVTGYITQHEVLSAAAELGQLPRAA